MPTPPSPEASYREAPARPPLPRPAIIGPIAVALGCLGLLTFTAHKLWVMAQLRGDIAGIELREMTIEQTLRSFGKSDAVVYQLRDRNDERWQIQLNDGSRHRNRSGEQIQVRCIERSHDCYARESVYIDDSNRQFDMMLLAIELGGLAVSLFVLRRRLRRHRQAQRLVAPPRAPAR